MTLIPLQYPNNMAMLKAHLSKLCSAALNNTIYIQSQPYMTINSDVLHALVMSGCLSV